MKKHWPPLALFALLPILLTVFACVPVEQPEPDWPVVLVTANITAPTTWTAGNVYVIAATDISVTDVLTIEPGTIVKFDPAVLSPMLTLGPGGIIDADGTPTSPIVFTSFYDDTHGGDSNDDGSATTPLPKDWDHINTNGEGTSLFDYSAFDCCEFYYGGGGTDGDTLAISSGSDFVSVTYCVFAHNDGNDLDTLCGVLNANGGEGNVVIQNNVFYDNGRPLSISDKFDLDDTNVFHNPANLAQTNTSNGIFVYTYGIVDGVAISWAETEVAYVIDDADWWIYTGGSLTLADNVVLKFTLDSEMDLQAGSGALDNYDGPGVAFTSEYDDTLKGDTNGDGPSVGQNNDWFGIYNDATSLYETWTNIYWD